MSGQSGSSRQVKMILNLGCLAVELHMKWNIKPFWARQAKDKTKCPDGAGDKAKVEVEEEDDSYYYISYNNITEEETLDLHYACSSPSSSCHHGDNRELSFNTSHSHSDSGSGSGYEEVQVEAEFRQREQYWSLQGEVLLVECC